MHPDTWKWDGRYAPPWSAIDEYADKLVHAFIVACREGCVTRTQIERHAWSRNQIHELQLARRAFPYAWLRFTATGFAKEKLPSWWELNPEWQQNILENNDQPI